MKKQKRRTHFHAPSINKWHFSAVTIFVALAGVFVATNTLLTPQSAYAAKSASDYCSQYSTNQDSVNACNAGIIGTEDCNDYTFLFGSDVGAICTKAATDRAAGIVTKDTSTTSSQPTPSTSVSPSTSPSTSTSPSPSPSNSTLNQIQDLLDKANGLSDYIDILHGINKPSKDASGNNLFGDTSKLPDNEKGYYVNGAGKKQEIKELSPGTGSSPAILFFNGGAWHSNDGVGEKVAGQPGGMYDNSGAEKAQDRGYALYDVTYRLGSSGVYYMFEDVMRGIKHMRDNAALYGIDPNKIVIWGDSAGGSLAMRAAASGKSGAKAAVGWSAITNAYTAFFRSIAAFAIGLDHSTCAPTDLAGFANFADLLNGGSGDVAQYGQGLSSNDFSALGISLDGSTTGGFDPGALLTQGLVAGKNLSSLASNAESISKQIGSSTSGGTNLMGLSSMSGSAFNLASKKFVECVDNFNALSPALFTSPDTPPTVNAEFENDMTVGPDQAYAMRDKLQQLGIKSQALILPGDEDCIKNAPDTFGTGCHLGYYKAFLCDTLNFIDSIVQPERGKKDCSTGVAENTGSANTGGGGTSSSGGSGSSTQNGNSNSNNSSGSSSSKTDPSCENQGKAGGSAGCGVLAECGSLGGSADCNKICQDTIWLAMGCNPTRQGQQGGNFNPNIQIDTSHVSTFSDPCEGRGGYIARPDGSKAPLSDFYGTSNSANKIVCYGAEW